MKITEIFKTIQETSSTNIKKQILKENMCDVIAYIFEDTYGKQKYYIKQFEKPTESGTLTLDNDYQYFRDILSVLANRTVTGLAAWKTLFLTVLEFDAESQEILCRIINRNLKIGISWDNYLDVIGQKDTKFEVALAENLSKVKGVDPIDGTYFISRKLDGVRCVCFIDRNEKETRIDFRSRQNKPFTTLNKLINEVDAFTKELGMGQFVLDGECCIVDEDGNENFHGLMKEITRKDHTIERPKYKVFDILTLDEFWGRSESPIFADRYRKLLLLKMNVVMDNLVDNTSYRFVDVVEQERVTSQEVLDKWTDNAKRSGWEGCMLRKNVPYKKGRTKDLLKIKELQDAEYEVIGIETGTATYNEGGHKEFKVVSALKIVHRGNIVSVGSGLSKEQRLRWYEHPEEILGETVTIQYFEETKDSKTCTYSLRFPVLKYVYENKREF